MTTILHIVALILYAAVGGLYALSLASGRSVVLRRGLALIGAAVLVHAAALAAFTMLVALFRHRADPFARMEMALLYFTVMATAVVVGGGAISLDAKLRRRG